ncbi:DNA photolyase [Jannaschia sp. S6380]|uniref:FAD-binding domain-containing protein n=1 Tax=Jannaschia sp. S6380 TaxID=2926408 RepID=UPI001FF1A547|nr:FAD-binding domain-containing protein [Jannaschia sp. S6380]MCK0166838.1 DNA photolyase [Jannaschia sp. S6380]
MDTRTTPVFPPDRINALSRLKDFVPRAGAAYARNRGDDLPGHSAVSTLSPYLSHRILTEAEVARAILDRHSRTEAEKFLSELLWRGYFAGWLERRPRIWPDYLTGLDRARDRLATEGGLRARWAAACGGDTGIAPFDHWAAELVRTGYLHNHARMWFASIWMHSLQLPWELGADLFMRHLLDGDPASNTLSWRWVAGLHTAGKVYVADAENIARNTGGRFMAAPLRAALARPPIVPPEAPPPPDPAPAPGGADLPSRGRIGLLLHEDDLHPDYLFTRGLAQAGTAAFLSTAARSPATVAPGVHDFARALAQEAVARHAGQGPVTSDPEEIARWAAGFDHIVSPYARIGPVRAALDASGIAPIRPIRAWDSAIWQHAARGYFRVRKRMPDILATIEQDMGNG